MNYDFARRNIKQTTTRRQHVYLLPGTYHSSTTELVNAIAQGLQAEHGVVTEDDILMELTKWVEATDNDILSDIYQQTINYVVSGQNAPL